MMPATPARAASAAKPRRPPRYFKKGFAYPIRSTVACDRRKLGDGVRRLERRDDALAPREEGERVERLMVGARDVVHATGLAERRMLGAHTGIIEPSRDRVRLAYLPGVVLEDEGPRAVQDTDTPADNRSGVLAARDPLPTGLHADELHSRAVEERPGNTDR